MLDDRGRAYAIRSIVLDRWRHRLPEGHALHADGDVPGRLWLLGPPPRWTHTYVSFEGSYDLRDRDALRAAVASADQLMAEALQHHLGQRDA
jgi:hypothetical protein